MLGFSPAFTVVQEDREFAFGLRVAVGGHPTERLLYFPAAACPPQQGEQQALRMDVPGIGGLPEDVLSLA
ncbi:hypothetical protein ACFQE7_31985 [Nonomuraea ferruginea]|uniref:hypothetical protein n=1 Tax=Nonomuraea ferruginea TaxID=46174 RepID=UPI003614BE9E